MDVAENTIAVEITDGKIASSNEVNGAIFLIEKWQNGHYTLKAGGENYIGVSSNSNGLKQTDNQDAYLHDISFDDDGNVIIAAVFDGSTMTLRYNKASNQLRFRYYKSGQEAIQLYKKVTTSGGGDDNPDTRVTTAVTLTKGYATTGEVGGRIALPRYTVTTAIGSVLESAIVTWESSNTNVATIDAENKVINLIAAGTTTIKATYAGDETNYKPSTASYTLTVNSQAITITSLYELQNQVTSTSTPANITFRDVQVVYVNGNNAYLADANGYGALLYTKNHGLEAGQVLNGTNAAKIVLYQGNAEITDFTKEGLTISKAEVTPTVTTINAITKAQQSTLVTLKNVTASVSEDGKTITLADGDKTITFYDKFKTNVTIENGKSYDITGVIVLYNETIEICPRTADDVAEVQAQPEQWKWADIKADFTNQNFLTDEEKAGIADESNKNPSLNFGLSIGEDGSATRVASDAENANAVISGQWHSNEHGISNFSATVKVEGTVKITFGTCAWGGDVEVKNAEGVVVTTMNTNTGACYHGDKTANVVSCYYKQDAATTLTISGGSYVPYFAVEKVDPKDIPSDVKFIFDITESGAEGVAPAEEIAGIGKKYTLPKNFTLYKEGATLTGWTDGTNTYAPGEEITAPDAESVTLTPVFTANTVSLADRTEPVTLKYNFRRDAGAPTVAYQNATGIWVAQATIDGKVIDVKADFDTNNGGKFANGNWTDWAQLNEGTTFHVPSCKGATVSIEAYNELTTTSIDGQTDYTSGKTINYTVASAAETVDVVIGNDGSYYRYIQVVLPVVQSQGGGKTYDNADAKVVWAMTDATNMSANVVTPDGIFSTAAVNTGDITLNGSGTGQATYPDGKTVTFIKLRPAGSTQTVEWAVKPAAGLTFKPTKISAYIIRFGTDAENGITISAKVGDGEAITLGNFTAPRNNKTQAEDKFGKNSNYTNHFEIELTAEQQAALASADGLSVFGTVGVGGGKDGGYAEMTIDGIINGTVADVNQYTLATVVSPEEAGSINVYPAAEQYEEGSEVTLTATENFGYDFVNWTNAAGDEVSTEAKFKYTMTADETLTANFRAVETYELALTIDGTNPYMVTISPAPTLVDGKMMYEAGTTVELNANQYDGLVTFTN